MQNQHAPRIGGGMSRQATRTGWSRKGQVTGHRVSLPSPLDPTGVKQQTTQEEKLSPKLLIESTVTCEEKDPKINAKN